MPVNTRRRTLAPGARAVGSRQPSAAVPPSKNPPGTGRAPPKSRKSMIPRCAGGGSTGGGGKGAENASANDNANRENNGRVSGIAAPSPSRAGRPRRPIPASRKSLGGAILQHGAHRPPAKSPARNRRVSLAPVHSAPPAKSPARNTNVDPRDIKDKSYLQGAIRKMVSYLQSRGYPDVPSLSVKQLVTSGPSGRDFQNIMTFLFRRIDPTFHCASVPGRQGQRTDEVVPKFEDEVSTAFRCLGYPFPVSKTGLVAVGSPHTWPALIAAIDWLIDVLTIRDEEERLEWGPDETDPNEEELPTLDESVERAEVQFHSFLRKSMVAFLEDDNEKCVELEVALLDELQVDTERVEAYLAGMDSECVGMNGEIVALNAEVDGLTEAKQKQEEYAENIEKFLILIQTLTDHRTELTKKVETITSEKSKTEQEVADSSRKIEQLKATIDSQELSGEDVRRMERKKSRIEEQILKQEEVLAGEAAALEEAREKWSAVYQLLERRVEEYNVRAARLGLIPTGVKHTGKSKLEIVLEKERAAEGSASLMGGVNMRSVFSSHVKKLVTGYEGDTLDERRQKVEFDDRVGAAEIEDRRLAEDIKAIRDAIASRQEECDSQNKHLESDIEERRHQLRLLDTKISALDDQDGVASAVGRLTTERRRLESLRRKQEEEYTSKKIEVEDEIRRVLELTKEYEDSKEKKLREMNEYIERRGKEAESIRLLDS